MQFQSKNMHNENFAPIKLDPSFPVAEVDYSLRSNLPSIGPHVHDCFEIGYCYEGSGIFIIENKILSFSKGDTVVINKKELHIMKANGDILTKWDFLNFAPEQLLAPYLPSELRFLETLSLSGYNFKNIFTKDIYSDICLDIFNIIKEMKSKEVYYKSSVRSLVWALMIKLHRVILSNKKENKIKLHRKNLARVSIVLEYIVENFLEPITIEELAYLSKSSISNFRKIFHSATGYAPIVYIRKLRLKVATSLLLNTDFSILEISTRSGYKTLSNFNRHFKDTFNLSPREFKTKNLLFRTPNS